MSTTDGDRGPPTDSETDDLPRLAAALLVGAAIGTLLICSGASLFAGGSPLGDDSSSHLAEIVRIAELLRAGRSDFWFDQSNLGYPLFVAYQPAPTLLLGAISALTIDFVAPVTLFKASIALLWSLLPWTSYRGGRWLGFTRLQATIFALLSIGVSDWRHGMSLDSLAHTGLYTQGYGMLLLPLAIGAVYRYLLGAPGGSLRRAALLLSLTLLSHVFFAMCVLLVLVALLCWRRVGLGKRARAAALLVLLCAAITAFWWIPFATHLQYQGGFPFAHESRDGMPLSRIASWLLGGRFLDHGRFPWMTIFAIGGAISCFRNRRQVLPRFLLLYGSAALVLFMGRENLGWLYGLIPFHGELEVIRYIVAIQFVGLAMATLAIAGAVSTLQRRLELSRGRRLLPWRARQVSIGLFVAICAVHLAERGRTTGRSFHTFDSNNADYTQLVAQLAERSDSRFVVHEKLGTSSHIYRNLLPLLARRPQLQSYARGYHDTASLYHVEFFDLERPSHYRLFNVRAVVSRGPPEIKRSAHLEPAFANRSYQVHRVREAFGYFDFVRSPLALSGGRSALRGPLRQLTSLFEVRVLPRIRLSSGSDPSIVLAGGEARPLSKRALLGAKRQLRARFAGQPIRSRVLAQRPGRDVYAATVSVQDAAELLLLKVSYHPYWEARVDGQPHATLHLGPNMLGLRLPPGRHEVEFRYRNPSYQKALFIGALLLGLLCALPARSAWQPLAP